MNKSEKKIDNLIRKVKKPKAPKYYLIETRSRHGTNFGFQYRDSDPVIISHDKDVTLDFIYSLERGKNAYDDITGFSADFSNVDEVSRDDVLTDETEE